MNSKDFITAKRGMYLIVAALTYVVIVTVGLYFLFQ